MPLFRQRTSSILIVDDDPSGLMFFNLALRRHPFEVYTATSVAEAQDLVKRRGASFFECVVTDYRMPGADGLELLDWLRKEDSSLSVILVTAGGEKDIVQASLRGGAVDFLEKPISKRLLGEAIEAGIRQTHERRRLETMATGVEAAGKMSQVFTSVRHPEIGKRLAYFHYSANEIGGDFLSVTAAKRDNSEMIMLGDVSGHDVKAGFISAFFQGLARGSLDAGRSPGQLLEDFNRQLNEEWANAVEEDSLALSIPPSLALTMIERQSDGSTHYLNAGLPDAYTCHSDGSIRRLATSSSPLGWHQVPDLQREELEHEKGSLALLMTDGLRDCALQMRIDPLALAFQLLLEHSEPQEEWLGEVRDDILVVRYQFTNDADVDVYPLPLIQEDYKGSEHTAIDDLQAGWRRSLLFALGDAFSENLYDVLLCCREAVLNAMVHGCRGSSEATCNLQVSWIGIGEVLRIRVDDPGGGHQFSTEKPEETGGVEKEGDHLGLVIIQNLSDHYELQNDGSSILFDFCLRERV